jgi:hypothetical protein
MKVPLEEWLDWLCPTWGKALDSLGVGFQRKTRFLVVGYFCRDGTKTC